MDFTLGGDRLLFAETLSDILGDVCPPSAVRSSWEDPTGAVDGLWETLAGIGVLGLTVPEAHGGLGMDEVDQVLLLEELGRAACPGPVAEHSAVAVPVLRDLAPSSTCDEWLGRAADGSAVLTAGSPADTSSGPLVLAGSCADLVVLAVDGAVHAVPAASVSGRPVESLDGARRLTEVTVEVSDATLVSDDPTAVTALWDRGAWAAAAQAVGVAQRLLDLTVTYVAEREQFGRPVGANQAVKHHCSNVAIAVEFARPIVQTAAWSLANGRAPEGTIPPGVTGAAGPSTLVSMAKAMASDAVDLACRSALQCHGAIGYTVEHDLQIWLKRGWALSASWGDAHCHRRRVAVDLGMVVGSGTSAT